MEWRLTTGEKLSIELVEEGSLGTSGYRLRIISLREPLIVMPKAAMSSRSQRSEP
jgi:hypothetical protein